MLPQPYINTEITNNMNYNFTGTAVLAQNTNYCKLIENEIIHIKTKQNTVNDKQDRNILVNLIRI